MRRSDEAGIALLLAMIALAVMTVVGFYMTLNATTEVTISDNIESQTHASYAAMSGLNHARNLLRGLDIDAVLKGPDGAYDGGADYIAQAKTYSFRLPISIKTAQTLDIMDPSANVLIIPDDGVMNTGFLEDALGVELIPRIGIGHFSPNPYGEGNILNARYFVKITDNNGDPSELAQDPQDNPFHDGDGIVIVRSVGVSKTFTNRVGALIRKNSIAVYESRLKRSTAWDQESALTVLGSNVAITFGGNPELSGDMSVGIATVDVNSEDSHFPDQIILAAVGDNVIVQGKDLDPSVQDVTATMQANPEQAILLQPKLLWQFIQMQAPVMADAVYEGNPVLVNGNAPFLGTYDSAKAWNAAGQNPRFTLIKGDLSAPDGLSGGGLLVVTGQLSCSGPVSFQGLILVIGDGKLVMSGTGPGVTGGVLVASLVSSGQEISWGTPQISISGGSRIIADKNAVRAATRRIPVRQISFREIAGVDP